jgi:hypothetical protein
MFDMAHAGYLREKARSMRVERQFTIDQLAERLALSRSDPTWRSRHGVVTVRVCDTRFRARTQAWMGRLRSEWQ